MSDQYYQLKYHNNFSISEYQNEMYHSGNGYLFILHICIYLLYIKTKETITHVWK
jgi:hypothetical protein